jgi:hypothetical protein
MEPAFETPLQGDYKETPDIIRFYLGQVTHEETS